MDSQNLPEDKKDVFGFGSVWTWTALDADTKLICSWMVGNRDAVAAREFIQDLAGRLANRIQLTTDGHKAYLEARGEAFGTGVDYAMLIKLYGEDRQGETRYSPAACLGTRTQIVTGSPNRKHVSTSYVERQNLTMRMHMRRFTRLTNAFSKKLENHVAAISLHFMYYNFVRIHQTLRITPAMAAGVTDRVWNSLISFDCWRRKKKNPTIVTRNMDRHWGTSRAKRGDRNIKGSVVIACWFLRKRMHFRNKRTAWDYLFCLSRVLRLPFGQYRKQTENEAHYATCSPFSKAQPPWKISSPPLTETITPMLA